MQASSLTANGHTYTSIVGNLDTDLQTAITQGTPITVSGPLGALTVSAREINGRGSGWLINGCPLNILFGQGWVSGQIAALKSAGITPMCLVPGSPEYTQFWSGAPTSAGEPITNSGTTTQGSVVQLTPTQTSAVAAAISTQLTPGSPGGLPTGQTVGQTFTPGGKGPTTLYRFIVASAPNRFDTGANYNGCSPVNSMMCDPHQFGSMADAVAYALSRNEIPYLCNSASEVWGIIDGSIPIDPARVGGGSGMSPLLIGGLAVLAYLLLK